MALLIFYGLAGVVRLGYFNVMEAKRQVDTQDARKYYQGLPITSMAIALPVLVVVSPLFPTRQAFVIALHVLVAVVGTLFIADFKLRKPSTKELFLLVGVVALSVAVLVLVGRSWWNYFRSLNR